MPLIEVKSGGVEEVLPWRDLYRQEMNCQIVHDAFHARPGWTEAKLLYVDGQMTGYGLIVVRGPWQGKPTVCEFYALPQWRGRAFDLFDELLRSSQAVGIEVQSNDSLATVMLHAFADAVKSESILFHDRLTTTLRPVGAIFGPSTSAGEWTVEVDGEVVAKGGILFHYNRPYGDIYIEVAEPFRRRGFGSYLVQELKRVAYEGGSIPSARCNPSNLASRRTLQKSGFVPCAHMFSGVVRS